MDGENNMKKYMFLAEVLKDDKRSGLKKGTVLTPKGFYYNKNSIILVGDIDTNDTIRLSFEMDYIDMQVLRLA
jgi:hypothetical protein